MKFLNMQFFNNKRLMYALSGVACLLLALVTFVISLIGFENIGAFFGGVPSRTESPEDTSTSYISTPTVGTPTPTGGNTFDPITQEPTVPPTLSVTTPPPTTQPPTTQPPTTPPPTTPPVTTPPTIPVTGVSIDQGTEYELKVGDVLQLTATVRPVNATDKTVSWSSTDESVVLISSTGNAVALKEGTAYISARISGFMAQIKITVTARRVEVTEVIISPPEQNTIKIGDVIKLEATVLPSDATDKTVTWESGNPDIISVSADGTVTALSEGETTVTATAGGIKSSPVTIKVEALEPTTEPEQ